MLAFLRSHLSNWDLLSSGLVVLGLILAWFFPRFGNRVFSAVERVGARLALNQRLAVTGIGLFVITLRLCLLTVTPIPIPKVHDEFSYLLAADTFVHGRLANPPHPMWRFFDTIHVNQHPTYMSKYPPAQGAALALGMLLGGPWIGVLLSCAAMCAVTVWALRGWLPPSWALLGALLLTFQIGVFSYWMNSYWGGAVAAVGGALVTGAFPRIIRAWKARDAVLLGLGIAILANSRPFEGLVLCVPVCLALLLVLKRNLRRRRNSIIQVVVPLSIILVVCFSFMAYYNWRGTGNPLLHPYIHNNRCYLSTPLSAWGSPDPPRHDYSSPQLEGFYNGWSRETWLRARITNFREFARETFLDAGRLIYFFCWPAMFFALPAVAPICHQKKFRLLIAQLVLSLGAFVSIPWFRFNVHYAGPLVCVLFCLISQALRHIRNWESGGRPVGIGLSRAIVFFTLLLAPLHYRPVGPEGMEPRARLSAQLQAMGGEHLVIVRYAHNHGTLAEWVYNNADIDHAKIVWARDIPGLDFSPLLRYFSKRRVWLVEPDVSPPRLSSISH